MYGSIAVRPNSLSSSHLLRSDIATEQSGTYLSQETFRAWTNSKDGFASLGVIYSRYQVASNTYIGTLCQAILTTLPPDKVVIAGRMMQLFFCYPVKYFSPSQSYTFCNHRIKLLTTLKLFLFCDSISVQPTISISLVLFSKVP